MTRSLAAALLVLALAGCTDEDAVAPGPSPSPSAAESSDVQAPSEEPSPAARHGSAEVTYQGVSTAWPERACETTRGMDGSVAGWMATFQEIDEQGREYRMGVTDSRRYVQIRLRGGYSGDGTYPSERVSVRYAADASTPALQTGYGVPGQRLVLRDGGREGTYTSARLKVKFSCDPADDTSTERGQAVTVDPEPGRAWVERTDGAAFVFEGVRCDQAGSRTSVTAGTFPHFFRVLTSGRLLLGVHGIVVSADAEVDMEGSGGTFRSRSGGVARGAFACG